MRLRRFQDLAQAVLCQGSVAPGPAQGSEAPQDVNQEPTQPYAFPLSAVAHGAHAIIPVSGPHQGDAVAAKTQSALNGPPAMLIQTGRFPARLGFTVPLVFPFRQSPQCVKLLLTRAIFRAFPSVKKHALRRVGVSFLFFVFPLFSIYSLS